MPNYMYFCEKCDMNFDDLCTFEQSKEEKTCPDCSAVPCPRTYDLSKSKYKTGVMDNSTGRVSYYDSTHSREAMEKEWIHDAVKGTEEALKYESGVSPYSRVKIPYEKLAREGKLNRVSEEEQKLRIKAAQTTVSEASKNMSKEDRERMANTKRNDAG